MKFDIDKKTITDLLNLSVSVLAVRPIIPALSGIYFTVEGKNLLVKASDGDKTVVISTEITKGEDGSFLLEGKQLLNIVPKFKDGSISWTENEKSVTIESSGIKLDATKMDLTQYPQLPDFPETIGSIDSESLNQAIRSVSDSVSKLGEFSEAIFSGILFIFDNKNVTLISTDKYRLSKKVIAWKAKDSKISEFPKVLVKENNLLAAQKLFEGENISVAANFDAENATLFGLKNDTSSLVSGVLDANLYPDITSLFDQEFEIDIIVDKGLLVEALTRADAVTLKQKRISLKLLANQIQIESGDEGLTDLTETIDAEIKFKDKNNASELVYYFNPKFLLDGARNIATNKIDIQLQSDNVKPIQFIGLDDKNNIDESFKYVLSPVRA